MKKILILIIIIFSAQNVYALSSGYLYYDSSNPMDLISTTTPYFTSLNTTASSTFTNGVNITSGCFSINNVCLTNSVAGISVTSITLATPNSTLSLGGTNPVTSFGTINADLNLAHLNYWTVLQNFTNASTSQFTATSSVYFTALSIGELGVDATGKIYSGATTTAGTGLTNTANAFNVNTSQNITTLSNLSSNGYVKTSGSNGTLGIQAVPIPIADGGSNSTSISSRNLVWFDGTSITSTSSTLTVGNLISTSTTATSTFKGALQIATTTITGVLNLGAITTGATTTIFMGKIQFDGYNSAGTRSCVMLVGTSFITVNVACAKPQ